MLEYQYKVDVRFRDCDSLGHINNAVYHTYTESCRCRWMEEALGWPVFSEGKKIPVILARTEMDFLSQGHLHHDITVNAWLSHIGQKSFHQVYEIKNGSKIIAHAKAVLVWFDFEKQCSIAIPDDMRTMMLKYLKES